jgi:hypothetical protein
LDEEFCGEGSSSTKTCNDGISRKSDEETGELPSHGAHGGEGEKKTVVSSSQGQSTKRQTGDWSVFVTTMDFTIIIGILTNGNQS